MTKTNDQIRNIIEDWLKDSKIQYQNTTEKQQIPDLAWSLELSGVIILMLKPRVDRITLTTNFSFSSEHQQSIEQLDDKEWWDFINDLNQTCINTGIGFNYNQQGKKILQIELNDYADTDTFTRNEIYHILDSLVRIKIHLIRKIQARFRTSGNLNPSTLSNNTSFYR